MVNLIYTALSITCLSVGFYFGFKIGKTSEMPKMTEKLKHPIKTMQEEKVIAKEEEKLNRELRNLDNYTSLSQEDI